MTLNGCADSSGNEAISFRLVRVSNRTTGRRIDIAQNFEGKPWWPPKRRFFGTMNDYGAPILVKIIAKAWCEFS